MNYLYAKWTFRFKRFFTQQKGNRGVTGTLGPRSRRHTTDGYGFRRQRERRAADAATAMLRGKSHRT